MPFMISHSVITLLSLQQIGTAVTCFKKLLIAHCLLIVSELLAGNLAQMLVKKHTSHGARYESFFRLTSCGQL